VSNSEWVAVAMAAVALFLAVAVLVGLRGLRRSMTRLQAGVDALAADPSLDDLHDAMAGLRNRVDAIARATGVPEPVEPVRSRVPTMLRSRGVVKAMALGSGTAHVARRLRNGNGSGSGTTNGSGSGNGSG
jgi:hypothetical protein